MAITEKSRQQPQGPAPPPGPVLSVTQWALAYAGFSTLTKVGRSDATCAPLWQMPLTPHGTPL